MCSNNMKNCVIDYSLFFSKSERVCIKNNFKTVKFPNYCFLDTCLLFFIRELFFD